MDRKRVQELDGQKTLLSSRARSLVPVHLSNLVFSRLGKDAPFLIEEMAVTLANNKEIRGPPLETHRTDSGDDEYRYGILTTGGDKSYRPDDSLSYDTIDDMMRNGQVLFAIELKKAFIRSVLRNERSWKVECKNERMSEVVRGIMERVFRRHAHEFLEDIPYGVSFFEKEWSYQNADYWGIDGPRGMFYGYKSLKPIHPRSIDHIVYKGKGQRYDGFVQKKRGGEEVKLRPDLGLVLTYNKKWRNLWGSPITDPMYPYWFYYEIALRSWLRYMERMGTPVTVAEAPSIGTTRTPDGAQVGNMKYAQLLAGYAAKSNAIAMPSDVDPDSGQKLWNISYLSADQRGDQFYRLVEMLGTMITRTAIMGDRAATQTAEAGSFAMSKTHMEATQMHNEFVLDELLGQVNEYVVEPLCRYNATRQSPPATIETEGLDPDEKDRLFKLISIAGNQADAAAMKAIDWRRIFEVNNIPTLTPEEVDELYEAELKRTEERNAMLAKTAQQGAGMPLPKKGTEGKPEKEEAPEKVKASLDYLLYQLSSGARVPLVLTAEQVMEIADKFADRPRVFDLKHEVTLETDDEIDQIKRALFAELGIEAEADDIKEKVWQYAMSVLDIAPADRKLESIEIDVIQLGKIGDWFKKVFARAKKVVSEVIEKVTGKSASEWKREIIGTGKYVSGKAAPVIVTRPDGTTYTWNPDDHPRDETGRFARKQRGRRDEDRRDDNGERDSEPRTGTQEMSTSTFDKDVWPGADPENGIKGVVTIDGIEYTAVGGVSAEEMKSIHATNLKMMEHAKEMGYELHPVPITVIDVDDPASLLKYFGSDISVEDAELALEEIHHRFAQHSVGVGVVIDNRAYNRPEILEPLLFHETLHGQRRELGNGGATPMPDDEVFTTLLTAQYGEKYGYPSLIGYPAWVSWAACGAQERGWSKQKLYEYAMECHKRNGADEYRAMTTVLTDVRGDLNYLGKTSEIDDAALAEWWPDWENAWGPVSELYDYAPGVLVGIMRGR